MKLLKLYFRPEFSKYFMAANNSMRFIAFCQNDLLEFDYLYVDHYDYFAWQFVL